ncbi:MAG: heme-binding protein [Myxococcales bacterium]|nr:heme-binding protein [Myxococcales bacterium]
MRIAFLVLVASMAARAQQWPFPYGAPVGVEAARKVAAAAVAEARKNGWKVAVAVVEPNGTLVYYEKMDDTQYGSAHVAVEKARASAQFRRPTKAFEDPVNSGKPNVLGLPGAVPLEGGLPLVVEGHVIGAIGVSGGTSAQDGVCAKAAHEVLGPVPNPGAPPPAAPPRK